MIMESTLGRKLIPFGQRKAHDIRCGHPPSQVLGVKMQDRHLGSLFVTPKNKGRHWF